MYVQSAGWSWPRLRPGDQLPSKTTLVRSTLHSCRADAIEGSQRLWAKSCRSGRLRGELVRRLESVVAMTFPEVEACAHGSNGDLGISRAPSLRLLRHPG